MSVNEWDKLDITADEVNKIEKALKNEEFRKLLVEYCQEISDPVNRKKYEEEIKQMENERGFDVTFIHPNPGYVIKTSANGQTKTFINIASNEKIDKPEKETSINSKGEKGSNWSIPYSLSPPRPDQDNRGALCHVYDAIFNPMVLELASKNSAFRDLVNNTALNAVEEAFKVELDKTNLKFPKLKYKGVAKPAVIRKKGENPPTEFEPSPIDQYYPPLKQENQSIRRKKAVELETHPVNKYATPKYKIVERHSVELNNEADMKTDLDKPKEIAVTIDLPLLNSTQDVNLDVTENMIYLLSENPAKYKVEMKLPYKVDEKMGNAKFDKIKRQLMITLPIVGSRNAHSDIDRNSTETETEKKIQETFESAEKNGDEKCLKSEETSENGKSAFLDKDTEYIMPSFNFHQIENTIALTLHVKNCSNDSIEMKIHENNLVHLKFCSIGSGYYPTYHSFCIQFPHEKDDIIKDVLVEPWDNNVIVQLELTDFNFSYYMVGLCPESLSKKHEVFDIADKPACQPNTAENDHSSLEIDIKSDDENSEITIEIKGKSMRESTSHDEISEDVFDNGNDKANLKKMKKSVRRRNNKKMRSLSESHCENLKEIEFSQEKNNNNASKDTKKKVRSLSESSSDEHINNSMSMPIDNEKSIARKGILKHRPYNRCISECTESYYMQTQNEPLSLCDSLDLGMSHDSLTRKTVRFSDNIKRQLFRSNTSILAQKKKNQKKKASRRRNRTHSEGSEDFDDKASSIDSEIKTDSGVDFDEKIEKRDCGKDNSPPTSAEEVEFKSGFIFDLEI